MTLIKMALEEMALKEPLHVAMCEQAGGSDAGPSGTAGTGAGPSSTQDAAGAAAGAARAAGAQVRQSFLEANLVL